MKFRMITLVGLIMILGACSEKPAAEPAVTEQTGTVEKDTAIKRTTSAAGASVFFITPTDGETLANPISIEFGVSGMDVVKAGDDQPNSGHHHLLIDVGLPELGLPIPADEHHVHFGDGSTSTSITLTPGEHSLQMLLGDYLHIPHNPALTSAQITITVE
jgi:hypothetical protein